MPDIAIHNETIYDLSARTLQYIQEDAIEYFGPGVRTIRVQPGITRHAFNAKTGEVRYAFFLCDDESGDFTTPFPMPEPSKFDVSGLPAPVAISLAADTGEDLDEEEQEETFVGLEEALEAFNSEDDPEFQVLDTEFDSLEVSDPQFFYEED
jgi:hypothetical protein